MPESDSLISDVNSRLTRVFDEHRAPLSGISTELEPLLDQLVAFSSGGKRTRSQFISAGTRLTGAATGETHRAIVSAATAVELFHAAALIHDDIIDRSDTRRGNASTHRVFEQLHCDSDWAGDAQHFGISAAILAGDLLLMWSDDLLTEALETVPATHISAARAEFSRMRTEVTAGQYLDVLEEHAWSQIPAEKRIERAIAIATSKSARYSVEAPMRLGVQLAGGTQQQLDDASAIGLPLGLAFQLRDDVIGVFGDTEVTGKPAGDDLREGKRTLLIAELSQLADPETQTFFDTRLGQPDLRPEEISAMQDALVTSGALAAVEARIQNWLDEAIVAINGANLPEVDRERLVALAERTARRDA